MILISNQPADMDQINREYAENSVERKILNILSSSQATYRYTSVEHLGFELKLRNEIINAAKGLNNSGFRFAVFRKAECNPVYWERTNEGGFLLKNDVKPSDAIRDIYQNGHLYANECATAMVIVYYKALLEVYGAELFDRTFPRIHLMDWHYIDRKLREIGLMEEERDYLPADRRYFANPDVDPLTPEWQGENVIDLGDGRFYGHGLGIHTADNIIRALNQNRREDADETAYLMDSAGRPNFLRLWDIYRSS